MLSCQFLVAPDLSTATSRPLCALDHNGYGMQTHDRWDLVTTRLVDYSTVTFTFLLLPQLIKNALALKAGNAASLAGLSWVARSPLPLPAHCLYLHDTHTPLPSLSSRQVA